MNKGPTYSFALRPTNYVAGPRRLVVAGRREMELWLEKELELECAGEGSRRKVEGMEERGVSQ